MVASEVKVLGQGEFKKVAGIGCVGVGVRGRETSTQECSQDHSPNTMNSGRT